jgi:hypothetical protein
MMAPGETETRRARDRNATPSFGEICKAADAVLGEFGDDATPDDLQALVANVSDEEAVEILNWTRQRRLVQGWKRSGA